MTIELTERIESEMADSDDSLDALFERLERMPVPEGFKAEIVEGAICMSPQQDTHWEIIAGFFEQLRARYPRKRIKSDVRIDFGGHLNGFAPDIVALAEDAEMDAKGRWQPKDIEFVAEVVSRGTAYNDYEPKKASYAAAGIPFYVIADPYDGECHLFASPDAVKREYRSQLTAKFGEPLDLSGTAVDLVLETGEFPRG